MPMNGSRLLEVEAESLLGGETTGCLPEGAGLTGRVSCPEGGAGYLGCGILCPEAGTLLFNGYMGAVGYWVGG